MSEETTYRDSIETIADKLNLSRDTVRRMAVSGYIPGLPLKTSREITWRFNYNEVVEALRAKRDLIEASIDSADDL